MKNKSRPFFYEEKKTPIWKKILTVLIAASFAVFLGFQVPGVRQIISEPLFSSSSFLVNTLKTLFEATRMYHEPEAARQTWTPLEMPEKEVLFAENLENLAGIAQTDPLADLRQTPTPSEFNRVAAWEYQDQNLNYAVNSSQKSRTEEIKIQILPPVFEHSDLFNDGAAILSANLRYWGVVENQYNIASRIHPDPLDPDISFTDLQDYIDSEYPEYKALLRINGDREILISLLEQNIPVIIRVEITAPYRFWLHDDRKTAAYWLIHGYASESDSFYYQDTSHDNMREIKTDELLSAWYPFQRTYLVVYPEALDEETRAALSENYYEQLNLQNGESKFRTDSEMLPENANAQLNYGIVLHRLGDNSGSWTYITNAMDLDLPQRAVNYFPDILETALELGLADDIDAIIKIPLNRNSHDEVLTIYKGWACILRGEIKEGGELFKKAEKINPLSELVLYAVKYKETMLQ